MQYVLKEPRGGEKIQGHSRVTDALITTIGTWLSIEPDALYVFDRYWTKSVDLWKEVQKASWDKVILDPKMKTDLVAVCDTFFDSEDTYKEYGVPWKRGLIFHGPPGNGKSTTIARHGRILLTRIQARRYRSRH
jgi:transitional endoplasmic reticulum ATPase